MLYLIVPTTAKAMEYVTNTLVVYVPRDIKVGTALKKFARMVLLGQIKHIKLTLLMLLRSVRIVVYATEVKVFVLAWMVSQEVHVKD